MIKCLKDLVFQINCSQLFTWIAPQNTDLRDLIYIYIYFLRAPRKMYVLRGLSLHRPVTPHNFAGLQPQV